MWLDLPSLRFARACIILIFAIYYLCGFESAIWFPVMIYMLRVIYMVSIAHVGQRYYHKGFSVTYRVRAGRLITQVAGDKQQVCIDCAT